MFFKDLILASSSAYRRDLLARLGVPFECLSPGVDEQPAPGETPAQMSVRLAREKAEAIATTRPEAVVIGSDQVALRGEIVLGKPGTVEGCVEQLRACSGCEVAFLTAVHLVDGPNGRAEAHLDRTVVRFRTLTGEEITRYVAADRPLDCAGGFKAESLGISLFDSIGSADPTALTGLPMIWLCGALRRAGIPVP